MAVYHPSPSFTQTYTNPQSKESIKDAGHDLKSAVGCSKCDRIGSDHVKLMKCAKCKIALYCSKECQKEHWPSHKSECTLAADQKAHALVDLVDYFLGNRFLHSYLEVALILELGLEPSVDALDKHFSAQFYVDIEPCDIRDFQRVWSPQFYLDPSKKVKMNGMFQLLGLTTSSAQHRDVPSARSRLTNLNTPDFADTRRKVDEAGHPWDPLVECEFVGITDGSTSNQFYFISICKNAFILAQAIKIITISEGIHKPLTVATCLEFINMHIRQDTQNHLHLRSMMKLGDVRMINYAGDKIDTRISMNDSVEPFIKHSRKVLQEKVERESVYAE